MVFFKWVQIQVCLFNPCFLSTFSWTWTLFKMLFFFYYCCLSKKREGGGEQKKAGKEGRKKRRRKYIVKILGGDKTQ